MKVMLAHNHINMGLLPMKVDSTGVE